MAMMRAHAKVMDQQNHQCRITLSPNKQSGQSSARLALGMGADQKTSSGSSTDLPLANEAKEADDLPKSVNANKDKSARPSKSLEEFEKEAFDALAKKKAAKDKAPGGKGACLKGVLKKPAKSAVTRSTPLKLGCRKCSARTLCTKG